MGQRKILFCDLDGTLLDDRKLIEKTTMQAVEEMLAKGHIFAVCTGRPLTSARKVAAQYGLDKKGCYIIAYNGGAVYDPAAEKTVSYDAIPLACAGELFRRAEAAGLYIHTYDRADRDTVCTRQDAPELAFYTSHTVLSSRVCDAPVAGIAQDPPKMIVASLSDHAALERFHAENLSWTKDKMNSFFSCEEYLEYCPPGVSKGKAVQTLCAYLDISVEASVAAGDERNDLSMLKAAGVSAVPANAHPDVLAAASYVCERDNNRGAVGEIIRKFIINAE